jgi:hypothetical protein
VATNDFTGVVRIGWRTADGLRWREVPVRAVDGGLRLDHGAVVEDDGRAWLRSHARWETLWADTHTPRTPDVEDKYHVRVASGPVVAGRPTRALTIARGDHVVERYALDRDTGLVLRRERFDDDGRVSASMAFVQLGPVQPGRGQLDTPSVGAGAPRRRDVPDDARRRIGDGFVLVGAHQVGEETQLQYSDGVFTASVFTRDGATDWDAMPPGGSDLRFGGTSVRRYRTASGTVVTWESHGDTITCVTDAGDAEQRAMVVSLRGDGDGALTTAVRFVTGPFSWF